MLFGYRPFRFMVFVPWPVALFLIMCEGLLIVGLFALYLAFQVVRLLGYFCVQFGHGIAWINRKFMARKARKYPRVPRRDGLTTEDVEYYFSERGRGPVRH